MPLTGFTPWPEFPQLSPLTFFLIVGIFLCPRYHAVAETWRRVWGDGKFFRGPRFLKGVFSEKISIFTAKISDDLSLVIDQVFRIFPFFSQIFRIFYYYAKCRRPI